MEDKTFYFRPLSLIVKKPSFPSYNVWEEGNLHDPFKNMHDLRKAILDQYPRQEVKKFLVVKGSEIISYTEITKIYGTHK